MNAAFTVWHQTVNKVTITERIATYLKKRANPDNKIDLLFYASRSINSVLHLGCKTFLNQISCRNQEITLQSSPLAQKSDIIIILIITYNLGLKSQRLFVKAKAHFRTLTVFST